MFHRQEATLDALKKGEIEDLRVGFKWMVDRVVGFGLDEGILAPGFAAFPDPRRSSEVPISALLLPQILQRLNDEHSLLLAPYLLNDAALVAKLGFNARILKEGFNERNKKPRKAPFHGETLKQLLLQCRAQKLISWFNRDWLAVWRTHAPGRTRQYILDGMKIPVPAHLASKYQSVGCVRGDDDELAYGYKAVWLQEIVDRKGVIVALTIVPIQVHDLEAAKPLLEGFPFEENSSVIMDRGFIDSQWITELKERRGVSVFLPLRRNMAVTEYAVSLADNRNCWRPHPRRGGQQIAEFTTNDGTLHWPECPVVKHGILVRFTKNDGTDDEILFVTSKDESNGKEILATYDQRAEIEESHRQMKLNQGIETLPSKKFTSVVFRILMGVLGFNLLNMFLNSEHCDTFEEFSLKTMRQKRVEENNPEVIVYTRKTFAVIRFFRLLPIILALDRKIQDKLSALFQKLDPNPAPA